MKTAVISVAAFADSPTIADAVKKSDNIRRQTLDFCYRIPGYEALPLREKNQIYDAVRTIIEKEAHQ